MAVSFELPDAVEKRLRVELDNVDAKAREAFALDLFRGGKLSHFELSQLLGMDRHQTDAYLNHRKVFEGSLSMEDFEADRQTLERVLGSSKG